MARTFYAADGLAPADFAHCGLDHITAARLLFDSDASHFDSAGYLAHIGVELLLKAWLLQVNGQFDGVHKLRELYSQLEDKCGAPKLESSQLDILKVLDQYEQLRYPNPKHPTEVGEDDWHQIESFVGFICRTMPLEIAEVLEGIVPGRKAGRILMVKKAQ